MVGHSAALVGGDHLDVQAGATFGGAGTIIGNAIVRGTLELTEMSAYAGGAAFEIDDVEFNDLEELLPGAKFTAFLDVETWTDRDGRSGEGMKITPGSA